MIRRALSSFASLVCVVLLPAAAGAQQSASSHQACDSVLRAARHDSVSVTARTYLLRRDGEVLTPRARSLLTETILAHFTAPNPLQLPVFSAGPVRMPMLRVEHLEGDSIVYRAPVLYGVYDFSLLRNGGVSKVTVAVPTLAPEFDSKIVAAILGATSDSTPAVVTRALDVDSVPLELRVSTGPEDTRLRVPSEPLFRAYFPQLRMVDAKPLGTNQPPVYPEEERDNGDDGEVALRVVVDAQGVPLVATLEVLHATSPAFALAAARALARYRFAAAHVASCGVPQVIEIPFWFSLRP